KEEVVMDEETVPPVPKAAPDSYGAKLTVDELPELGQELARLGTGLVLASLYGLALGARHGGADLLRHALGAPLALIAIGALAMPSLLVMLMLFDAPITLSKMFSVTARAVASTGLVASGLAPATALLLVTIQSPEVAVLVSSSGLVLAGAIGALPLLGGVASELSRARAGVWLKSMLTLIAFALFLAAFSA